MDTLLEPQPDHAQLATTLAEQGVEMAVAAWIDITGRPKSKFVPVRQIAGLLAGSERYTPRGMGNLGIAQYLHLSERTVKRHLSNVYKKIDVHSRGAATKKALSEGWISAWDISRED